MVNVKCPNQKSLYHLQFKEKHSLWKKEKRNKIFLLTKKVQKKIFMLKNFLVCCFLLNNI